MLIQNKCKELQKKPLASGGEKATDTTTYLSEEMYACLHPRVPNHISLLMMQYLIEPQRKIKIERLLNPFHSSLIKV